ncbi:YqeG family HAD IIIA-type phosphatase [Scatolibacter rhodanostii]|uniref:YqeG family HAD IIIA-type phosphatase n=1 Tax=Scatolibacter rhodanostii TaxID=2014781 RepID=UPI000C0762B2|nr:YqeG family HAD IIIA-type phosphatase [Scatolibacter rhodanostii]
MSFFKPSFMMREITQITPAMLKGMGVEALLLDVDNTLVSYVEHEPVKGAIAWVKQMEEAGLKLIIVSNNYASRVGPFADKFGLPYITFSMKPLPFGYIKASKFLKVPHNKCAIIGDQIFTDVIGANLCGMKSILLEPVEMEKGTLIEWRRAVEKKFRDRYKN